MSRGAGARGGRSHFAFGLFCALFALLVLPVIAYVIVSFSITRSTILRDASQHCLDLLQYQRDYLTLQMEQVATLAADLDQAVEIKQALGSFNGLRSKPLFTAQTTNLRIGQTLAGHRQLGSLVAIDIFALDGTRFHVGNSAPQGGNAAELRQRLWDRAIRTPSALVWNGVEEGLQEDLDATKVLMASKILNAHDSSWLQPEPQGLMVISYSTLEFRKHFGKVDLGRKGYLMLLDGQRKLIYHPDPAHLGGSVTADFAALLKGERGSSLERIGDERVLLSYEHLQKEDWYLVSVVPQSVLLAPMAGIRTVGFSMLGIISLVLGLVVWFFMERVLTPIGAIVEGFRSHRLHPDGPVRPMETPRTVRPVADLVGWFNLFLANDQERRKAEQEVHTLNAHLEDRVRRRTQALAHANAELLGARKLAEAANHAKSQFLSTMSHELRTPLNAILGFSQILRRTSGIPERERGFVDRILRAGEHLLGLINEVLSIAKIESGTLTLNRAPFRMGSLVDELQEILSVRAQEKDLILDVRLDPLAEGAYVGDVVKLRQVLINLLGNAVKFTGKGRVALRVGPGAAGLRFEVEDTGPGLAPEELATLFQAFQQAEAGRRAREGTGLGLAISQVMVQLMGGEISVRSTLGEGSTFWFELPMERQIAPAEDRPAVRAIEGLVEAQLGQKALVVDDRADNRDLMAELLTQWGFQVRTEEDGMEAVAAWEAWQPDVVWMDLVMPRMGGVEAVARIRAREVALGRGRTPIIGISASALDLDPEALRAQDFDDLVVKPFQEFQLAEALERCAGMRFRILEEPGSEASSPQPPEPGELPGAWREAFRTALIRGDQEGAMALAKDLASGPRAAWVRSRIEGYRGEELMAWLESLGATDE